MHQASLLYRSRIIISPFTCPPSSLALFLDPLLLVTVVLLAIQGFSFFLTSFSVFPVNPVASFVKPVSHFLWFLPHLLTPPAFPVVLALITSYRDG